MTGRAGDLRDGLYRVTTASLCAGFVVERGRVAACAPILRRRFSAWRRIAVLVPPPAGDLDGLLGIVAEWLVEDALRARAQPSTAVAPSVKPLGCNRGATEKGGSGEPL